MNSEQMRHPTLNWGLSTLGCPELNLPQAVALADQHGIRFLEIRTLNNTVDCQKTLYFPENEPVMRQLAKERRCRVLDSSFGLTASSPDAKEALLQIARTADDFGIPYIRVFGGGAFGEPLDETRIKNTAENLRWFREQGFQAQLALETHDICSSATDCRRLQECVGEDIPIVWDAHHTRQLANEPFKESFSQIGKSIVAVHFKDSHYAYKDGQRYCEFDILGEGLVPLQELFSLLEEEQFQGPVTLEHEKFWRKYLPEIGIMLEAWKKIR